MARTIISAIPNSLRIVIRSWLAMRWGQRQARKGEKVFRKTLQDIGMPDDIVADLTRTYCANAKFLSIRYLSQYAIQGMRWGEIFSSSKDSRKKIFDFDVPV